MVVDSSPLMQAKDLDKVIKKDRKQKESEIHFLYFVTPLSQHQANTPDDGTSRFVKLSLKPKKCKSLERI
jgi:hypothetical protein